MKKKFLLIIIFTLLICGCGNNPKTSVLRSILYFDSEDNMVSSEINKAITDELPTKYEYNEYEEDYYFSEEYFYDNKYLVLTLCYENGELIGAYMNYDYSGVNNQLSSYIYCDIDITGEDKGLLEDKEKTENTRELNSLLLNYGIGSQKINNNYYLEYDEKGNLISYMVKDHASKEIIEKITYEYDKDKLITKTIYSDGKNISEKISYTYNEDEDKGNLTHKDNEGNLLYTEEVEYDSLGNIIKSILYNQNGEKISSYTAEYYYY